MEKTSIYQIENTRQMTVDHKTQNAFIKAFDNFTPKLFRFCVFRVKSKELAEDLTSQAFLQTWQYIQSGRKIESYSAFLYQTMRNLISDHFRKQHFQTVPLEEAEKDKLVSPDILPDEFANKQAEFEKVISSLNELSKDQRDVLYFRYIDELSIKEISGLTGKKTNAVYVSIFRGIRQLKKLAENKHV